MLKHLKDILPRLTSHGVGEKRVLLSAGETETAVTQIVVTTLHVGGNDKRTQPCDNGGVFFLPARGSGTDNRRGTDSLSRGGFRADQKRNVPYAGGCIGSGSDDYRNRNGNVI